MSWKLALAFFQLVEYISYRISNSEEKKHNYLNMKRKLFFAFWWWYLSLGWVTTAYCLGKDPKLMKITQFSVLKVDLTFGQENTVQFVSKWLCKEVVVLCGSAEVSQTWSHHYLRQLSRTSRAEDRNSPCNDDYGTTTYQLSQKLTHFSKPLFKVSVVTREKKKESSCNLSSFWPLRRPAKKGHSLSR